MGFDGVKAVRAAVGLAGAVVAGALIAYAAPVVRAEYGRLFVSDLETAVRAKRSLAPGQLADLAAVLRDSYAYRPDPAIAQDLALVESLLSEAESGHAAAPADIGDAAALLRDGLAARPPAPHAWTRLARVRYQRGQGVPETRDALVLAITTGPTVRRLTVPRLEIGLRLWDELGDYERGLVRRQARLAFEDDPRAAVRVALAAGRAAVVRGGLTSLPAQSRFDALAADLRG